MEPLGPVVSSGQVPDSLNTPNQNLKVPLILGTATEEKAAIAETEKPDGGRCLTFFCLSILQPPH
jgi:hypothetical protein